MVPAAHAHGNEEGAVEWWGGVVQWSVGPRRDALVRDGMCLYAHVVVGDGRWSIGMHVN
jgi:hypothetical protein